VFNDDKKKEEAENFYNFGEQDVEVFGGKIQNKADRDSTGGGLSKDKDEEDEDKNYVKCI
jgi:hypothetical protein